MVKNSQLRLVLETSLHDFLKSEAAKIGISTSALCRDKLSQDSKLDKILVILQRLEKKISGGTKNVKNKSNR